MAQKVLVVLIIISPQMGTVKAVEIALILEPGDSFRVPSPGRAQMVPSVPGGTDRIAHLTRSLILPDLPAGTMSLPRLSLCVERKGREKTRVRAPHSQ